MESPKTTIVKAFVPALTAGLNVNNRPRSAEKMRRLIDG